MGTTLTFPHVPRPNQVINSPLITFTSATIYMKQLLSCVRSSLTVDNRTPSQEAARDRREGSGLIETGRWFSTVFWKIAVATQYQCHPSLRRGQETVGFPIWASNAPIRVEVMT